MVDFTKLDNLYFIGEIGINHNGSVQIAKKLMDAVHATGWDCAKFQKRDPDICVPAHQKQVPRETPWGTMSYIEYKRHIEFGKSEYDKLIEYAHAKPIDWSASAWDINSLDFIVERDVPFIKIASALVTDLELLKEAANTKKPIVMSTGMSTLSEVDAAVNQLLKHSPIKPVIMHTNSSYPTPVDEINLRLIPFYKDRYECIIGYSGHEVNLEPTVIAVALGAQVIERHITISHNMWGTDQKASLEVHAMNMLKKRCDNIQEYLGTGKKEVTKSEIPIRKKLRKQ